MQTNNLKGVILNAYPDSIGGNMSKAISILKREELQNCFSLFYALPTFFNSDLDRGFSIIDYNINKELVTEQDLNDLKELQIDLKLDIVLNHLSVASPQFKNLLANGDKSPYKDFFINWNEFWKDKGQANFEGIIIPDKEYLDKLFMRKSDLPVLKVAFPDGSERPYWNTFYQKITYHKINIDDLKNCDEINEANENKLKAICEIVNQAIDNNEEPKNIKLESEIKQKVIKILNKKRTYLGQMDVNAKSPLVWEFYQDVLSKLQSYGCKVLRLDAFAYLHKELGKSNFFNKPGTWDYLIKIDEIASKNNLKLLPEIHAEYGLHLHDELAEKGYLIYDFFMPGLIIHALEKNTNEALLVWANELVDKDLRTVNMLGCHDGIPLLDLKGKQVAGEYHAGLLSDQEIEEIMTLIIDRGGRVKNLYGADGKKISYYQVNASYYSALGEDDKKMLLARAIQLFMPGTPQIWYLDLFAGKNDYEAVDRAGEGGHKEINRTTLSMQAIEEGLQKKVVLEQLKLIQLRNTSSAFEGKVEFIDSSKNQLHIKWSNNSQYAILKADLSNYAFEIIQND